MMPVGRGKFILVAVIAVLLVAVPFWRGSAVADRRLDQQVQLLAKGVNFSHWLAQASLTPEEINSSIVEDDFALVRSIGMTHVRVPVDPDLLQEKTEPYRIRPENFEYLDRALDWADRHDLAIVIDLHPAPAQEDAIAPAAVSRLEKLWGEIAKRYRDRSERIFYELLNEPQLKDAGAWREICNTLIRRIREVDQRHTIIVGAHGWSNPQSFADMKPVGDGNVIYTFHFYEHKTFTHQGADWVSGLETVRDIPYPYDAARFRLARQSIAGAPAQQWLDWYEYEKYNPQKIARDLEPVLKFRQQYRVPVYCGEFGVYKKVAPAADRLNWHRDVANFLSRSQIGYALWEYRGGFDIFDEKLATELKPRNRDTLDWSVLRAIGL